MNKGFIRYTIGTVMKIEALILLVPILTGLIYRETETFAYVLTAVGSLVLGFIFTAKKPADTGIFLRDGCVVTVVSWLILSFVGGLPFFITGEMNGSFIDSMFESVSGFTTTGATILSEVETLSRATMIWRSLSHWIGGMGVLVFLLALIPLSSGSNINIMRAESTGPSVGKLVPKVRETAIILYTIYIVMTLLQIILLLICGTSFFDAFNIAVSTTGTGGFGIKNDSLASYSTEVQWVTTIFMLLASLRFEIYYFVFFRNFRKAISDELLTFIGIYVICTGIVFADLAIRYGSGNASFLDTALTTASIISTTGFSTVDFNTWPAISRTILVALTFIGGCSGSTAGGFKVSRIVILAKSFRREIHSYLNPRSVKKIRVDGATMDEEIIRSVGAYFSVYIIIFAISVLLVSIAENDLITNFTSVAATFNNVGPGISLVGPTGNFGFHTVFSKIVLIFDMLAGRLEIFPMIIFFSGETWKIILHKKG